MNKLLKAISFALLPCLLLLSAAARAQDPITKSPVPDQDLRNEPLLKKSPLPMPQAPDLTRVGVEGASFP